MSENQIVLKKIKITGYLLMEKTTMPHHPVGFMKNVENGVLFHISVS